MVNIKQEIKDAFVDNKYLLLFSALLFLITLFLGYFLQPYLYNFFNPVVNQLSEDVSNGTIKISFATIFLNNIQIVFRLFIFGVFFCFSTVILAYNGFFLGYFIANYGNLLKVLLLIIPHGIFELPSIVIANAAGLGLFKYLFNVFSLKNLEYDNKDSYLDKLSKSFVNNGDCLKQALILLAISGILMVMAGIIEVYVTRDLVLFLLNFFNLK